MKIEFDIDKGATVQPDEYRVTTEHIQKMETNELKRRLRIAVDALHTIAERDNDYFAKNIAEQTIERVEGTVEHDVTQNK